MSVAISSSGILDSTQSSGFISNIVNTAMYPSAHISCDIFKSYNNAGTGALGFSSHIKSFVEPNAGGHYYAHSYYGSTYQSASCRIPLSQCSVANLAGIRRACISLSVHSFGPIFTHCDIGLGNDGNGWFPICWCEGFFDANGNKAAGTNFYHTGTIAVHASPSDPFTVLPGTNNVNVQAEVGHTSTVDYIRATFTYNGETGTVAFDVPSGQMFQLVNNVPEATFIRFMSLIPLNQDGTHDNADGSALSAVIDTLRLGSTTWDASKVQYAWLMQKDNTPDVRISNIRSSTIGADADYVHIYHTVQTH